MVEYIMENLSHREIEAKEKIQVTVYVQFIVESM